jgi:DNA polymerase-1
MHLLVDGTNLAVRAARSGAVMTHEGRDTAPLAVFIASLRKLVKEHRPTHLGIAFDDGRKTWRHRIEPGYKHGRHPGVVPEEILGFCAVAGVDYRVMSGYEADDVLARWWAGCGGDCLIVSGDHDLLQLLGSTPAGGTCRVLRYSPGLDAEVWTAETFTEYYGYPPERYALVHALSGDRSDNIPGIAGVGPTKALALLNQQGWSLAKMRAANPEHDIDVLRYYRMINLREAEELCSLLDFRPTEPDTAAGEALLEFFASHGLARASESFCTGTLWS